MSRYLIIAEKSELSACPEELLQGSTVIITGPGMKNVISALRGLPTICHVVNFGYCGGYGFEKGTVVRVKTSRTLHARVNFKESITTLDAPPCGYDAEADCYTSTDFVESADGLTKPCVVDMELAAICAFGFRRVSAIKIVSDNLSYEEYKKTITD